MSLILEYPPEIAELAVDFETDLGPAILRASALVPWQNEGQNYAACQTSHAANIFEITTPNGTVNTGMLRHFYKAACAGTSKGSDLLVPPLYPVILGGHLSYEGIVLLTQEQALSIGAFEMATRAR